MPTQTKSEQDTIREQLLAKLAELGGRLTAEEDIIFRGEQFVLPERVSLPEAVRFLEEKIREDERTMNFARTYQFRPWDGARATMAAFRRAFGMVSQRGVPSLFGERPPQLMSIPVGVGRTEQVPWGGLGLAHLPGCTFYLGSERHSEYGLLFELRAEAPKKYRFHIEGIFKLVEEELARNSMYRGKAFDGQETPQFMDLTGVDPSKVIYSEEVMTQLEANVWSIIRWPDKMRELGVPLKRAVLFEGPYGTGKTLAAYLTAQIAEECGWTFVYCRPGRDDLDQVMSTARLYQPAVVFFEDLDIVAQPGEPDHVSKLLDVFDGIQAKDTELIAVLTTNHVERIHKGMVRPGRLDAVIHIGELDRQGFERLVRSCVPADKLDPATNFDEVAESMEGFLPAFAREAVDRAIRYNVSRNRGEATRLGTADFVGAATGLRPQLLIMQEATDEARVDGVGRALARVMDERIEGMRIVDTEQDARWELALPEERDGQPLPR